MGRDETLSEALASIGQIRLQMARAEVFRGYRSITTAVTGLVAIGVCLFQSWWPPVTIEAYLTPWLVAAAVGLLMVGGELSVRFRRAASELQRELMLRVIEHFVPCLMAGGLLTFVLYHFAPDALWILPGLWAVLFGLGVFATRRMLPHGASAVGGWYLLSGLCGIAVIAPGPASAPWQMGISFGIGQLMAAGVLYWNLEREHGTN